MKKIVTAPASGATTAAVDGVRYRVKPGVEWVNGKLVTKANEPLMLTDAEAAYDLSLERISPVDKPVPASWQKAESNGGD